jgi:hypothetical protein
MNYYKFLINLHIEHFDPVLAGLLHKTLLDLFKTILPYRDLIPLWREFCSRRDQNYDDEQVPSSGLSRNANSLRGGVIHFDPGAFLALDANIILYNYIIY